MTTTAGAAASAFSRIVRLYRAARAVLGVALVVAQAAVALAGIRIVADTMTVSLLYALQAVVIWLLPRFHDLADLQPALSHRRRPWVLTIGVDLIAFSILHALEPGSGLNFAALLLLPVLMGGLLTPRLWALATATVVSVFLLAMAWRTGHALADWPLALMQSGLAGMGLFFMAILAGELAARLAREERAARGSLEIARQQAQLNRLVIEEMADGLLVVDRDLLVRAANPAARTLIGLDGMAPVAPFSLFDQEAWRVLQDLARSAWERLEGPEAARDVEMLLPDGVTRRLRVRARFTRPGSEPQPGTSEAFCVLWLQDQRDLEARARQDRLAAMGRVSAGIAHEIRNPLAAISQATSLLQEDNRSEHQARLLRMVAESVRRLQRIVEDVLEVAPGVSSPDSRVDAEALVSAVVQEWTRTVGLSAAGTSILQVELTGQVQWVQFDADHLRRVLINLLDNAFTHGRSEPGSIRVRLDSPDPRVVALGVFSDGEAIAPDVQRHLFEPFFSTRSRGSGLGLYICRELCERHAASLEYRPCPPRDRHRNAFLVIMRRPASVERLGAGVAAG